MEARHIVDLKTAPGGSFQIFTQKEWQSAFAGLASKGLRTPENAGKTLASLVSQSEIEDFRIAHKVESHGLNRDFHKGVMLGLAKAASSWSDKKSIESARQMFQDTAEVWFGQRPQESGNSFDMFRAAHTPATSDVLHTYQNPMWANARQQGRLNFSEDGTGVVLTSTKDGGLTEKNILGEYVRLQPNTPRPGPISQANNETIRFSPSTPR